MNIHFYTWHSGNQIQPGQTDRVPESADPRTARPGSYDRATFHTQAESAQDDTQFARILAKNITGQLVTQNAPDPERISRLRKMITDGSYHIDDMDIARAMTER